MNDLMLKRALAHSCISSNTMTVLPGTNFASGSTAVSLNVVASTSISLSKADLADMVFLKSMYTTFS